MKAFANVNPRDLKDAIQTLERSHAEGRRTAISGGGTDLLGMIKDRLVAPDVLLNMKALSGLDAIDATGGKVGVGGLVTLALLASDPLVARKYRALSQAAESVGTPQIRNVATLAGNVCQRPWCWYLRNGFPCHKNGGDRCFAPSGENQFHAIFGGGPSFIVHPSDTAVALLALDASFRIVGPAGERVLAARDFFVLPKVDRSRENVLRDNEIVVGVVLPGTPATRRSVYKKLLDREAWTHAVVSVAAVLDIEGQICRRARIVLGGVAPIPWDRPRVARLLEGRRITPALAARAADAAVEDASPLTKNAYKIPLTRALVRRTLLTLAAERPGNG